MAYHFLRELTDTFRQSPVRAALASVLLIASTLYVCVGHDQYSVVEIGETTSPGNVIDLALDQDGQAGIEQVSAAEEDVPATSIRDGERIQYIDARLTHAVAEEEEPLARHRARVEQVSGQTERGSSDNDPVWLLGILIDD